MSMVALLAVQAAAQPVPAALPLPTVIAAAGSVCEQAAKTGQPKIPAGAQLYMNMYRELGGIKPLEQVPALVKRFAATQPAGGAGTISGYVGWPNAGGGDVWAVLYTTVGCDIAVTGAVDAPRAAEAFARSLQSSGYALLRSVDGSADQRLSLRLLLKRQPTVAAPAYGTRVRMTWLPAAASKQEGIQVTISYLAGDIAYPSTVPSTTTPFQGQ